MTRYSRATSREITAPHGRQAAPLVAAVLPLVVGLVVHRQGFNLLDDGLWILGGKLLAEGKLLYRDLFTLYGPARFVLLLPFFALAGKSALALALLKAVIDAVASGLGFVAARRLGVGRAAWLVPLGVVALGPLDPRYVALGAFALYAGTRWSADVNSHRALRVGIAWGLLSCFGLDASLFGAAVLGAVVLLAPSQPRRWRVVSRVSLGCAATLGVALVPAIVSGTLGDALWQTIGFPLTHFYNSMHLSWLATFANSADALRPFASVFTGEKLGSLFPLHASLRAFAIRALYLSIWLIGPWALVRARRGTRDPLTIALAAFATVEAVVLFGRGEVVHLKSAWLGSLWLLPLVVAQARTGGGLRRLLPAAAALLLLLSLAVEPLWMTLHASRPTLEEWSRSTARIKLARPLIEDMEALFASLKASPGESMLIWPAYPGLHALMDVAPASRYVTLLTPGEIHDHERLFAQLNAVRAKRALIGFSGYAWFATGRTLEQMDARVWTFLRANFGVENVFASDRLRFKILKREPGGLAAIDKLPLMQRLNDREFSAWTGESPPLIPGFDVGQSFRVGELGFSGIGVSFSGGAGLTVPIKVAVWAQKEGEAFSLLGTMTRDVALKKDQDFQYFKVGRIDGTEGRSLIVTFEVQTATPKPVSLLWYRHGGAAGDVDFCPDGSAYVGKQAVDADLYFLSY